MSNEKKPDEKPEPKPAWYMTGPGGAKAIQVRSLRIPAGSPNVMELPPPNSAARAISDIGLTRNASGELVEPGNQPRIKIWFVPWLGCFAVECYKPTDDGMKKNGQTVMVPREWAHWTPFE